MSKQSGHEASIRLVIEKLRKVNLAVRSSDLGLSEPQNGILQIRAFGTDMTLRLPGFQLFFADSDKPVESSDHILVLHYLLCDLPLHQTDQLISFRDLKGGMFYWEPFFSRTVRPLIQRIGNDLELLRNNLERFDWEPVSLGDLGARIHVIGRLYLTLIYRLGDEEFPASADLLFDAGIKRVYDAEDAAVLASRISMGLIMNAEDSLMSLMQREFFY